MVLFLAMGLDCKRKEKLEAIYRVYRNKIYYWAQSVVYDDFIAEDIVHNLILFLAERPDILDKLKGVELPETNAYLAVMTRHMAYNLYRKDLREKEHLMSYFIECGRIREGKDEIEEFLGKESMKTLSGMLAELPEKYKTVFTLKYVDEYSNEEIGKILGIGEDAIRKRLERARVKVKEIYNRYQKLLEE